MEETMTYFRAMVWILPLMARCALIRAENWPLHDEVGPDYKNIIVHQCLRCRTTSGGQVFAGGNILTQRDSTK